MIIPSQFKPAWWLPGAHLQTIGASFLPRKVRLATRRERIELPDGDFVDLDWADTYSQGPIVIVLHGLGGSLKSIYARGLLQALTHQGWRAVLMNFRGCSGSPNRLARFYHSGDTADVQYVIEQLRQREVRTPLAMVGYSLGGNVLLKWLGETGANNPLVAAIAVSVPFQLDITVTQMNRGFAKVYQWWLLKSLHKDLRVKAKQVALPASIKELSRLKSFWEFDDKITAPLHGFTSVHDYYQRASSRQYLSAIAIPTLILQAVDDPLVSAHVIPSVHELSNKIHLELSHAGGHVGFISGKVPLKPKYWLDERICEYLKEVLATA